MPVFILTPSGREIAGSLRHHAGDDELIACDNCSAGVLLVNRLKYLSDPLCSC